VTQEQSGLAKREAHKWTLPWTPAYTAPEVLARSDKVRVAVIREEGSNGDREMSAAVFAAGMEPWDITMSDLIEVGGVGLGWGWGHCKREGLNQGRAVVVRV